ncbi:hypothetical protein [Vulcanisaeta sp. JCM 16159]|uniref:hypothetical protein n=1 Tax=Vulcanisaeta sp. JCM 16159 TaxID=1295371 RepID=UPI0006D1CCBC|nr:hypothetical protein [Vulcanisaeta sp. JCM 16159]
MSQLSEEERVWALVAWIIPLIGGVIGLVIKPGSGYVRHWSYLSIAFGIVIISVEVILGILSLITILILPMHIVIVVLGYLAGLALLITWIIGILRVLNITYWKPMIIYDIAKMIGAP